MVSFGGSFVGNVIFGPFSYLTHLFNVIDDAKFFRCHGDGGVSQHKSNLPQEAPTLSICGVDLWESWLSPVKQRQILKDIRAIVTKAPLL